MKSCDCISEFKLKAFFGIKLQQCYNDVFIQVYAIVLLSTSLYSRMYHTKLEQLLNENQKY